MYKLKRVAFIAGVLLAAYLALSVVSGRLDDAGRTLGNGWSMVEDFGNGVNDFLNAVQGG